MCITRPIAAMSAITTGAIFATVRHGDEDAGGPGCADDVADDGAGERTWVELYDVPVGGPGGKLPEGAADFHDPLEPVGTREESVSRLRRFRSPRNSAAVW